MIDSLMLNRVQRNKIIVADDQEVNRAILRSLFEDSYEIIEANNGEEAFELLKIHEKDVAIMLLDMLMPARDGMTVLGMMSDLKIIKRIPVILITGVEGGAVERSAYEVGVADVIHKPFDPVTVQMRVRNVIELYHYKENLEQIIQEQTLALRRQTQFLAESNSRILDTLSSIVEFRDAESGNHIRRIRHFTRILLEYISETHPDLLKEVNIDKVVDASMMHDIGKIAIPDAILLKPGRLTSDEFEVIKSHTIKGCEMLKKFAFIDDEELYQYCYSICRYHHERYDGKGYPDGLMGDEIPVEVQVVSLVDVYDALVSKRCYKDSYSHDQALKMIWNKECGCFSDFILDALNATQSQLREIALQFA